MRGKSLYVVVLSVAITLLVPVLLTLISVRLIMTETYLNIEYHKADFPPDTFGFSLEDRLYYAPFAIRYMFNNEGIDYLGNLKFSDGHPLYIDRELEHMVDVKRVFQGAMLALVISAVLFIVIAGVLAYRAETRFALRLGLMRGSVLVLVILVMLVALLLVSWDTFFDSFHDLFFAQGTWQFYYSDSLIRLFPVRFWQDAALTVGGMAATFAVIILIGCWLWYRSTNRSTDSEKVGV